MDLPTTTENIPKKRGRKPISPSQKKRNKNECRRRIYRRKLAEAGKQLKIARTAEETKAWRAERIPCECGCVISRGNLPAHRRSKKHERLMYEISTRVDS